MPLRPDRPPLTRAVVEAACRTFAALLLLVALPLSLSACSTPSKPAPAVTTSQAPTSAAPASPATGGPAPQAPNAATSSAATVATATAKQPAPLSFSVRRVLADTRAIEKFGVRVPGSAAEKSAAGYVAGRLRSMGYRVSIEKFHAPAGTSRNVTAVVRGTDTHRLVLSGHLDTRSTTKGANDNALGCAIVLEMARIFTHEKPPVTLELTMFGSEEYNDGTNRDHHRGSRYHVAQMSKAQLKNTLGMISLDVVGYGTHLHTRTMGIGPLAMSTYLLRTAARTGVKATYLKDPGPTGWSDHEPYEKAGVPAVWLERLQDPQYHKMGDTTAHLQTSAVRQSGRLVLDAIRSLDRKEIRRIEKR